MRRDLRLWILGATACAVIAVLVASAFLVSHRTRTPPPKVSIALTTNVDSVLVQVAAHEGYFRDAGLDVMTIPFTTGKSALESVLQGKAQFATVAETPVVLGILNGENPIIVAGIFSSDRNMAVLARRDAGISMPGDLRGKRIAVPLGTNAHYFLHAFLIVERVPVGAVSVVGMPPDRLQDALATGQVDAISVWHPFLISIQKRLGANGILFDAQGIYTYTFNVATTKAFAAENPNIIVTFLRALARAEAFVRSDPEKTRQVIAKTTGWDQKLLDEVWSDFSFRLSLDQTLLTTLENEARWAISSKMTLSSDMPNFLHFIYFPGMQAVAPRRITIAQ